MRRLLAVLLMLIAPTVLAKDVTMAFSEKIPPFCFPETNSGIEIEVIAEALATGGGHRLKPVCFPCSRVPDTGTQVHDRASARLPAGVSQRQGARRLQCRACSA